MYTPHPIDPGDLPGLVAHIEIKRKAIKEIALNRVLDAGKLIAAAQEFRALSQLASELIADLAGPNALDTGRE